MQLRQPPFRTAAGPAVQAVTIRFQIPVLTEDERDVLLQAAWELNKYVPSVVDGPASSMPASPGSNRPGDDFNDRGDVRAFLEAHGWVRTKKGENEYWRRPGKDSGTSATLKDRVFYVFSSNAGPFEPNQHYSPFGVCGCVTGSSESMWTTPSAAPAPMSAGTFNG